MNLTAGASKFSVAFYAWCVRRRVLLDEVVDEVGTPVAEQGWPDAVVGVANLDEFDGLSGIPEMRKQTPVC